MHGESPVILSLREIGYEPTCTWTRLTEASARVSFSGPEIEHCIGDEGTNPATENDWSLLPFMALSDGAHLYETAVFPSWESCLSGEV